MVCPLRPGYTNRLESLRRRKAESLVACGRKGICWALEVSIYLVADALVLGKNGEKIGTPNCS